MSLLTELRTLSRGRDFRRLFGTRLVSQSADGCFQVGLASLFFFSPERQTSAGAVAGAFTVLLLPYSIVGPFAGIFLDRWRRRQVLVWSNVLRAAMVAGVAALIAAGVDGPLLYAAVLACLSVNRFFLSGLSASLPHVVRRDQLVVANSVTTTAGTITALLGAGVGYLLKLALGESDLADAQIVLVAALVYALAATRAARMDRDLLGPDRDAETTSTREALRRVLTDLGAGARHVWHHRAAANALGAITAHRFSYGISLIAVILLERNYFNDSGDTAAGLRGLAIVFAASGAGFFVAAVITPPITHRISKQSWIVICFLLAAVTEYGYLAFLTSPLVVAGAFLVGVAAQGSKICVDTLVQESVDDAFRGRVFSFYDVLFNMAFVSACAFAALVLPANGASRVVYGVIATGYLLTAIGYGAATRRRNPSRMIAAGSRGRA